MFILKLAISTNLGCIKKDCSQVWLLARRPNEVLIILVASSENHWCICFFLLSTEKGQFFNLLLFALRSQLSGILLPFGLVFFLLATCNFPFPWFSGVCYEMRRCSVSVHYLGVYSAAYSMAWYFLQLWKTDLPLLFHAH